MTLCKLEKIDSIFQSIEALEKEFVPNHHFFSKWMRNNSYDFFKGSRSIIEIKEDDISIGYILLHYIGFYIKINAVFICEEFRNHGYAKEALKQLVNSFGGTEHLIIFGQCRKEYINSEKLLKKVGFTEIGINYNKTEKKENLLFCFPLECSINLDAIEEAARSIYDDVSIYCKET